MERNTSGELQAAEGLVNFGEAGDVKQPRRRVLSRKAEKFESLHKRLLSCMHAVEGQGVDSSSGQVFMNDLKSISQQFSQALDELIDLYSQDKHGELGDSLNTDHYINDIKDAYVIMDRINIRTNKSLGTRSLVSSRHSSNRCLRSPQETHTLCVFDRLPVVSWRRAKYKQMYGLKSTLTVSR